MTRRLSEKTEPFGRHRRLPVRIRPKSGQMRKALISSGNGRLRGLTHRPYRVRTNTESHSCPDPKTSDHRCRGGQPLVGRPQHLDLSSIAYCCKIITLGDLSALTMQAALVELMTTQLVPLDPLPTRKEPVPVTDVSQLRLRSDGLVIAEAPWPPMVTSPE